MLIRYLIFAAIAIALNMLVFSAAKFILEQLFNYPDFAVIIKYTAKLMGIASGFMLKYILDKKYVFNDSKGTLQEEAQKVGIYGLLSIFTTLLLFVISEGVERIIDWKYEVYAGWLIGLIIGYLLKYFLDKRFVFKQA